MTRHYGDDNGTVHNNGCLLGTRPSSNWICRHRLALEARSPLGVTESNRQQTPWGKHLWLLPLVPSQFPERRSLLLGGGEIQEGSLEVVVFKLHLERQLGFGWAESGRGI